MTTPPAGPQDDDDEPRTEAGRRVIADWGAQFLNGLDLHTITDRVVAIEEEAAVRGGAPAALRERRAKIAGRFRHRRERFRCWLAAVRHVPHPRSVWCGDQRCPYAIEAVR